MEGVSTTQLFEAKPRWPGAPPICLHANLPAFETFDAWKDFYERNAPGCKVERTWLCDVCHHYHGWSIAPDPSGSSSGTGRSSK
jgi:hypothetical protein